MAEDGVPLDMAIVYCGIDETATPKRRNVYVDIDDGRAVLAGSIPLTMDFDTWFWKEVLPVTDWPYWFDGEMWMRPLTEDDVV